MFNRIEINGFRGIKHVCIEGFKNVNLFFGKNNCGKSSLLESLFLAAGLSNPVLPININGMRDFFGTPLKDLKSIFYNLEDLELIFYNLDSTKPISIQLENEEKRNLNISIEKSTNTISLNKSNSDTSSNLLESKYGLKYDFNIKDRTFSSKLIFDSTNPENSSLERDDEYEEKLRCRYLAPKFNFDESRQGLNSIIKNKDEDFIVEGLKIIEPRVQDFKLTDKGIFVDMGLKKRIPINMMGDGIRKIIALLTTIYDCENGVVLIDEISNGFHYSVMQNLWKVLINAAIKNNTQLFVSTHDYDSIKGFRDATLNTYNNEVAAFSLVKTSNDELKAFHYSVESLDYALKQNSEIR